MEVITVFNPSFDVEMKFLSREKLQGFVNLYIQQAEDLEAEAAYAREFVQPFIEALEKTAGDK